MKLIVGLGNPGKEYANNRHNVGFQCVDYFARKHAISINGTQAHSRVGTGTVDGVEVLLAKPQTYMNLSGDAVVALMGRHRISVPDIIVVYDDLDLPVGKIRIRERGSAGGHNGIKSIIARLGTQEFVRIRVGAAPEGEASSFGLRTPDFVLSDFSVEEQEKLKEIFPKVSDAVVSILTQGVAAAMNRFN